jgi:hypothetical protein
MVPPFFAIWTGGSRLILKKKHDISLQKHNMNYKKKQFVKLGCKEVLLLSHTSQLESLHVCK